jgi:hypothetical protein
MTVCYHTKNALKRPKGEKGNSQSGPARPPELDGFVGWIQKTVEKRVPVITVNVQTTLVAGSFCDIDSVFLLGHYPHLIIGNMRGV